MTELFPGVYYLPGDNHSRFPFSAGLYLKGRESAVLVDIGMGEDNLAPAVESGVDALILTHSHIDHHFSKAALPDIPIWCHSAEEPYLADREVYWEATGIARSGLDLSDLLSGRPGLFGYEPERFLEDGERIDLGGLVLEVIHSPGHTPGHLTIRVPEFDFLFTTDLDLTKFGPFYGHDYAELDPLRRAIRRLAGFKPKVVASSHAEPILEDIQRRFQDYAAIIERRERDILARLEEPTRLEEFARIGIIYQPGTIDPWDLMPWFEMIHAQKHLEDLERRGKVVCENDFWFLT